MVLRTLSATSRHGRLEFGGLIVRCAIGKGGRRARKREGDGATPMGRWLLREVRYRADRGLPPRTGLPLRPMHSGDGWCDAARDRNYNRPVRHPYPASAEHMLRADALYDVVVVLAYNERPRIKGLGSAIFMHLARPGYEPTAGCIALRVRDLRLVLRRAWPGVRMIVPG